MYCNTALCTAYILHEVCLFKGVAVSQFNACLRNSYYLKCEYSICIVLVHNVYKQ